MTDSPDPTDSSTFNDALNTLLQLAHENGIDVEGAWKCTTNGNGRIHWDVQITGVEYSPEDAE